MRYARCEVCRRNRLLVAVNKDWKLRSHALPLNDPIPERAKNGPCPGSGRSVPMESALKV